MSCRMLTWPSPEALLAFKKREHYRNCGVLTREKEKTHWILTGDIIFIQIHHSSIFQLQLGGWKAVDKCTEWWKFAHLGAWKQNEGQIQCGGTTISAPGDMRPHPCTHREMEQRGLWGGDTDNRLAGGSANTTEERREAVMEHRK